VRLPLPLADLGFETGLVRVEGRAAAADAGFGVATCLVFDLVTLVDAGLVTVASADAVAVFFLGGMLVS
jgi:hypothetical protein